MLALAGAEARPLDMLDYRLTNRPIQYGPYAYGPSCYIHTPSCCDVMMLVGNAGVIDVTMQLFLPYQFLKSIIFGHLRTTPKLCIGAYSAELREPPLSSASECTSFGGRR